MGVFRQIQTSKIGRLLEFSKKWWLFYNYCQQINQCLMSRLDFYQRLNRLLQAQQTSKFLQQITQFELISKLNVGTSIGNFFKERTQKTKQVMKGDLLKIFLETEPLLFHTQQTAIERISEFIIQIDKIEKDVQVEKRILFKLRRIIDKYHLAQMPSHKRQHQGKGQQQQVTAFERQIAQIQKRIHLIKLLDNDIDTRLEHLRQRNKKLQARLAQTKERKAKNQMLIEAKQKLTNQIVILEQSKQEVCLDYLVKQGQVQEICEVICEVLRYRNALQKQVAEEETQKQNLSEILDKFQGKYQQVKHKNQKLKQNIEEVKRSAIFQLLQF